MGKSREEYLDLWYRAAAEPIGLLLRVSEPELFRNVMFAARREAADSSLLRVQIRHCDLADGNVVMVKVPEHKPFGRRPKAATSVQGDEVPSLTLEGLLLASSPDGGSK